MIKSEINEHQTVVNETFDDEMIANIYLVGKIIDEAFKNNGKVIIFGNGGSAADAQHISAEFISKLKKNRKSLPAIALTVDTSALTAIGNDYGYEDLFSRQISSLCSKQDIVIGISTSGNSKNVNPRSMNILFSRDKLFPESAVRNIMYQILQKIFSVCYTEYI